MSVDIDGRDVGEFQSPGIAHPTKRRLRLSVAKTAVVDDLLVLGPPEIRGFVGFMFASIPDGFYQSGNIRAREKSFATSHMFVVWAVDAELECEPHAR